MQKDLSNSKFSHQYYDLYQLKKIKNEEFSQIFEEILKFPASELNFVQKDIKYSYHYRYFSNYIFYDTNGLGVKTIVVEKKYTCQTFLDDYINYYANCYTEYGKNCRRVHFFKKNFDENVFQEMVYYGNNGKYKKNWESYLGCIIIRPLPKGIIGITYLKTYEKNVSRNRYYTALSLHTINLYGTTLEISTMPFMEQDSNVGACASTALWMAFQKTSELFHTKKPSPSEITLLAGSDSDNTGKFFPNKGLSVAQICNAIYNNGLCSEVRYNAVKNKMSYRSWLQGFVYAYLKAEIPILLGVEIEDIGFHLITLNGYRFKFDNEITQTKLFCKSQFISKFYAHDDQIGPFSRLKFNEGNEEYFLRTSWWKTNVDWKSSRRKIRDYFKEENNSYNCKPTCLIIPLDRKIKVQYEDVKDKISIIDYLFDICLNESFVWDIFLIKSNTYKEQIKKQVKSKETLQRLLYTSLPLYIWVAQAYVKEYYEEPIFDFIFDSVEMPYDGKPFLSNIYSTSFKDCLEKVDIEIRKLFSDDIEDTAYKKLVEYTDNMYSIYRKIDIEDKDNSHEIIEEAIATDDKAIAEIQKAEIPDVKTLKNNNEADSINAIIEKTESLSIDEDKVVDEITNECKWFKERNTNGEKF
jgi:hypothetical protein